MGLRGSGRVGLWAAGLVLIGSGAAMAQNPTFQPNPNGTDPNSMFVSQRSSIELDTSGVPAGNYNVVGCQFLWEPIDPLPPDEDAPFSNEALWALVDRPAPPDPFAPIPPAAVIYAGPGPALNSRSDPFPVILLWQSFMEFAAYPGGGAPLHFWHIQTLQGTTARWSSVTIVLSSATVNPPDVPPENVITPMFPGTNFSPMTQSFSAALAPGQVLWYRIDLSADVRAGALRYLDITTYGTSTTFAGQPSDDTAIALYRSDGTIVAVNDDDGLNFESMLTFGAAVRFGQPGYRGPQGPRPTTGGLGGDIPGGQDGVLPAGSYYLAVAGGGTRFRGGFLPVPSSFETGTVQINIRTGTINNQLPPGPMYFEAEPNDTPSQANFVSRPSFFEPYMNIDQRLEGQVGNFSDDYFLVIPRIAGSIPEGTLTRNRLTLLANNGASQLLLIGRRQVNGSILPGSEVPLQNVSALTTPQYVQWYQRAASGQVLVAVQHARGSDGAYQLLLEQSLITPPPLTAAPLVPGPMTFSTADDPENFLDTALRLYNADFSVIVGASNDDAAPGIFTSRLARTIPAGTYFLAVSTSPLCVLDPAPPDDAYRDWPTMRFAGTTASGDALADPKPITLRITDFSGTRTVNITRTQAWEVLWYRVQVGSLGCGPSDIAATDASPGPDGCVDNGDFLLFISSFFSADCDGSTVPCNPADIAATDASAGPDGLVDNGDFLLFISSFFSASCPGCSP
jgi:hypothetical protein